MHITPNRWAACGLLLVLAAFTSRTDATDLAKAAALDETQCTTLFAFDHVSIPYTQNLRLEMRVPSKHPANPVVPRGEPGTPDSRGVQFYGSVIREGRVSRQPE